MVACKDPIKEAERRKKISIALKGTTYITSKEACEKRSETAKKLYATNPEYYAKICRINKENGNKPEEKKRRSERMKEVWARPGYKENTMHGGKHGNRTEETKQRMKNAWTNERRLIQSKRGKKNKGIKRTYESRIKISDSHIGHWYGNVRYDKNPIYCELWKDVNPRVHAFFDYKCVLCGEPENGRSHIGHHVFYVKEACCWYSDEGVYYTNLNVRKHLSNDYCIGENPNYFVILCRSCHGKTNGGFKNRKKYADLFKQMIDDNYGGKSYLTKEEYSSISGSSQTDHQSGD